MDPNGSAYYFLKVHLHHFLRKKVINKSQNSGNQDFSYYFALTNVSESRRPKNIWILRIRIRIRIPNTAKCFLLSSLKYVWDPGYEIWDPEKNLSRIPDPGVSKARDSGSRNTDPQHRFFSRLIRTSCSRRFRGI